MSFLIVDAKRIVIKIGSSLLIDEAGNLCNEWLNALLDDVAIFIKKGQQVAIVSSGAIALGRAKVSVKNSIALEQKQALAAIGQIKLAHAYQKILADKNLLSAQLLLTLDDSENRRRYLNAKNTLLTLFEFGAVPIINENDTVATAEIRYGDNDRLAARVAQMISADVLILLSDIDGLYTADPHIDSSAKLIPLVTELDEKLYNMAQDSYSEYGSGGMKTKLSAAQIAMASGCKMLITLGRPLHVLRDIDSTNKKTWFIPNVSPVNARKNWLAHHLQIKGSIVLDPGAEHALYNGKSLLAVGILSVSGEFHKGDAIEICNQEQQLLAKGLANYSANEITKIKGQHSKHFEKILGYQGSDEVIHRDDLVLLRSTK